MEAGNTTMNDNQESEVLSVMEFEKQEGDRHKRARLTRFHNGGAYVEGAEEVIFEGREDSWRNAINYLEQRGYRPVE